MTEFKVTAITPRNLIGEGPHWMTDQSLLYVDITRGNLHRYFIETKRLQTLHIEDIGTGDTVGFIVPVEGHPNEFVIGIGRTLATVKWSPSEPDNTVKKPRPLLSIDLNESTTRFNDAKCDPAGRLWAGTMACENESGEIAPDKGTLYRFDSSLKSSVLQKAVSISNGLAWSSDKKTFYFIDSMSLSVDAFDYDHGSGNLSNQRSVLSFKEAGVQGLPDGMTIDTNGNLWVACFTGSQVICVNPTAGKVIRNVNLPASKITSCCWGGPDYATLFVTSASVKMTSEELERYPESGKTFAITGLGAKGMAPAEYKVKDIFWMK